MKFNNKWTYGLVAVGAVSLTSAVRADEAKLSAVQTALSNTTISGYVSASANVALDPNGSSYANSVAGVIPFQSNKQDGFNLDVVKLSISKPQDESAWASGYQVDLLFGPDAVGYNTSANADSTSDFAIKQAYVALRTPVGNGIDWKIGVFDTILGYEVFDAGNNPNYTRSYGYAIEPTEHTGILGTYKINDIFTVSAGVANSLTADINARNESNLGPDSNDGPSGYWKKTVMGSVAITAPSSWGWASGSMLYAGAIYGFASGVSLGPITIHNNEIDGQDNQFAAGDQFNAYAGATLNTPWKALTLGAAFDYVQNLGGGSKDVEGPSEHIDIYVAGLYATYKATDKLSFNARGEYIHIRNVFAGSEESFINNAYSGDAYELTGTVEYDLWANVISRVELRWDHVAGGTQTYGFNNQPDFNRSALGLYANIIYKF